MPKFKHPQAAAEFKRKMAARAKRRREEAAMEVAKFGPKEIDGPTPKTVIARGIQARCRKRKGGLRPQFKATYIVKNWPKFIPIWDSLGIPWTYIPYVGWYFGSMDGVAYFKGRRDQTIGAADGYNETISNRPKGGEEPSVHVALLPAP